MDRLKALCEIAETGQMSRVARGDGSRQSQLSRQVKDLELFFGTGLVDRRKKQLTGTGKDLVALVDPFLKSLEKISVELSGRTVAVSLGAGQAIIDWVLFPKFSELAATFPRISWNVLNLTSTAIRKRLLDFDLDFGILRKEACSEEKSLEMFALGSMDFVLVVPTGLKTKRSIPTASLQGSEQFTPEFERIVSSFNPPLEIVLRCESFPAIKQVVRSGSFAGVLPLLAAHDLREPDFSVMKHSTFRRLTRNYVLACNKKSFPVRPDLERIREKLLETCCL